MKEQMSVNVSGEGVVVSPGKVRNGNNGVPDANNGKEMISDSELAKIQAINKVSLKDRIKSYKRTPGSLILFLLVSLADSVHSGYAGVPDRLYSGERRSLPDPLPVCLGVYFR